MNERRLLQVDILEILHKYSSENNPLIQKDIIDILKNQYGYENLRRQTVKDNIEKLIDHFSITDQSIAYRTDQRIVKDKEDNTYMAEVYTDFYYKSGFKDSELILIIDSLLFSKQISQSNRKLLIEKLEALSGKGFNSRMRHISTIQSDESSYKVSFENIKEIDKAISESKKISFNYMNHVVKGSEISLEAKKNSKGKAREYRISPYYMAVANERYYLICNNDKFNNISHYRIDKMQDIKILDEKRKPTRDIEGMGTNFSLNDYMAERIYMFGGNFEYVKLKFDAYALGEFVDWFGVNDIVIQDKTEDTITARVKVNRESMRIWALRYALHIRVLSPQDLVDDIKKDIRQAMKNYE